MSASNKSYFCYRLHLYPEFFDRNDWQDKQFKLIEIHFNYLKVLMEKNILLMAGRTVHDPMTANDFGIVILETKDETQARELMENDPAVKGKLMYAELFPFSVALLRK